MIRFQLGDVQLTVLDAGRLWLDGGAMFGVVPKALWSRLRPPDDANRIELAMNLLLVEDGRRRTLVDTGAGDDWSEKHRKIYRLDSRTPEQILEPAALKPEQVDRVICSHLHFDHAGGNTVLEGGGRRRAAYPNAEYVMQRGEVATARWDHERIRASYRRRDFEPLVEAGQVRFVEETVRLDRCIEVRIAPGHTPHMQIVLVRGGGRTVAFLADLIPTASHVPYPYIMGYDLEPLATYNMKKRILPEALREGWWLVFEHDAEMPLGMLAESEGRLAARPVPVED